MDATPQTGDVAVKVLSSESPSTPKISLAIEIPTECEQQESAAPLSVQRGTSDGAVSRGQPESEASPKILLDVWQVQLKEATRKLFNLDTLSLDFKQQVVKLVTFAFKLAREGHENHSVGTIFVISPDVDDMRQYAEHLCPELNLPQDLHLRSSDHERAITNLCLADGAAIFDGKLNLAHVWQRLSPPNHSGPKSCAGGAKHTAGRGMTSVCKDAVAIVISESGGRVTIFHKGTVLMKTDPLYVQRNLMTWDAAVAKICSAVAPYFDKVQDLSIASVTSEASTADTLPVFKFTVTQPLTPDELENVKDRIQTLWKQGLSVKPIRAWLEHQELRLDRRALRFHAIEWFNKTGNMVSDMVDSRLVDDFSEEVKPDKYENMRLLRRGGENNEYAGSRVARLFEPFNVTTDQVMLEAEIVLNIKGDVRKPLTSLEEDNLGKQVEKDILDLYKTKVTFLRISSLVIYGPLSLFHLIQDNLDQSCDVVVAGYTVQSISFGKEFSFSLCSVPGIPAKKILHDLHEWMDTLNIEESKVSEPDLPLPSVNLVSAPIDPPVIAKVESLLDPNDVDIAPFPHPDSAKVEDQDSLLRRDSSSQALYLPQVLAASAVGGLRECGGLLHEFPTMSIPKMVSLPVPERIIQEGLSIQELSKDHGDWWCAFSGADGTISMIQHEQQLELLVKISKVTDGISLLEGLEWVSSTRARVKESITNPKVYGVTIPQGYMVLISTLQQRLGRELSRERNGKFVAKKHAVESTFQPGTINFFMPEFDMCPSSMTRFLTGDRIFVGLRETSFREILTTDARELATLKQNLDDEMVLRKEMTIKTKIKTKDGTQDGSQRVLPGSRLLGSKDEKGDWQESWQSSKSQTTLVFETSPEVLLKYNFRNTPSGQRGQEHSRFHMMDYFRVAGLGQQYCLADGQCPLNRANLRINILGIARQFSANEFWVDWNPGPLSKIADDDLVLLPRMPPSSVLGEWPRFWDDADVESVARANPAIDYHLCNMCSRRCGSSLLVGCGHTVCPECAKSCGLSCPLCRTTVEQVVSARLGFVQFQGRAERIS